MKILKLTQTQVFEMVHPLLEDAPAGPVDTETVKEMVKAQKEILLREGAPHGAKIISLDLQAEVIEV